MSETLRRVVFGSNSMPLLEAEMVTCSENYHEILQRLGLSCGINVIFASLRVFHNRDNYLIKEVNIKAKDNIKYGKGFSINKDYYNLSIPLPKDTITIYERHVKYRMTKDWFTDFIIDFINKENISDTANNEYIRYIFWDGERMKPGIASEPSTENFYVKVILVELNKKCLVDFKNLDLYRNVKQGTTDWMFRENSVEEVLIKQGHKTLNNLVNKKYDLYDRIHNLSLLRYERQENTGKILFNDPSTFNNDSFIEFRNHIALSDTRNLKAIRKLLEISIDNIFLLCDGENIYGIAKLPSRRKLKKGTFSIRFKGQGCWELRDNCNDIIMSVFYGVPSLPKQDIDEKSFFEKCVQTFSSSELNCIKLWDFVDKAREQQHGTMIVITDEAKKEAYRLGENSFPITANEINDLEFIYGLTSIDGAIMLDSSGKCYSIGCILDGISDSGLGDSSRGARYNSALRYINYCDENDINVLIVIVSEDGMIDVKTNHDIPNGKQSRKYLKSK
ncbi:DNA integrity scanning protein DisA nucleotide-binding domain protein [Priestia megaterium]|uniref:DNA integrity scanning protein DisA nucleotide-binding domain protein n=1 Tax=Priestia megaterium TaxID=1404 RepID=UPI0004280649